MNDSILLSLRSSLFGHLGKYEPFDIVTRKSLLHAVADAGSKLSDSAVDSIMAAYFQLASFDDASPAWNNLADVESLDLWIFSNGTHEVCLPFEMDS
jgi:2-haloacid dehalogenase